VAEQYAHGQLPADGGVVTTISNLITVTSKFSETVATLTKEIYTLADQLEAKYIWAKSKEA
jgi:hypothetical protein